MMDTLFLWPIRVYYEDTDAGGVVYHSNYLKFMERTRSEWLRQRGFEQESLYRKQGLLFAVANMEIQFLAPARLDDTLSSICPIAKTGAGQSEFEANHPSQPRPTKTVVLNM